MPRTSNSLPTRFPVGSKYVVESWGPIVRRYVDFPDGRRVRLSDRMALACSHERARFRPAELKRRKNKQDAPRVISA
jgi:hypothetical protein